MKDPGDGLERSVTETEVRTGDRTLAFTGRDRLCICLGNNWMSK